MTDEQLKEELYDLYGYMASAAKELLNDPMIYGPFRMVDALSRIISLTEKNGKADSFSLDIQKYIEENKYTMMSDEEEFKCFLNELVMKIAGK